MWSQIAWTALPQWTLGFQGSWHGLNCNNLWLQLPWPIWHIFVSLWIIHTLCSLLKQEHTCVSCLHSTILWNIDRPEWLLKTKTEGQIYMTGPSQEFLPLKGNFSFLSLLVDWGSGFCKVLGDHFYCNRCQIDKVEGSLLVTHNECLTAHMGDNQSIKINPNTLSILSWTAVTFASIKSSAFLRTSSHRGNQDVKNGMGVYSMAQQLLQYAAHCREKCVNLPL